MPNEVTKLPDGRISAKLETGEIFEGDPLEVTQKMAEAHVNTKRWGQEWKAKAETVQQPNPPSQPQNQSVDPQDKQLQDYLLTQTARGLGYNSADEYKADLARVKTTTSRIAQDSAITQFFTQHPEYPATEEANAYLGKIFDEKGWTEMTADNFHLAHLEAMDRHRRDPKEGYEALPAQVVNQAWADRMQQANRPTPPPMLGGNNPELAALGSNDPYQMPLNDLRKAAIKQQLEPQR